MRVLVTGDRGYIGADRKPDRGCGTERVIAPISRTRSAAPARLGNAKGELISPNDVEGR
jgi:hypothetical protein